MLQNRHATETLRVHGLRTTPSSLPALDVYAEQCVPRCASVVLAEVKS